MKNKKVIIAIPAYNEEKTLGLVIDDINRVMKATRYNYKIQVLNDGSKDNTEKISKSKGALTYSHKRNKGLAETFKSEIHCALKNKADIIVHTDADAQYCSEPIPLMITGKIKPDESNKFSEKQCQEGSLGTMWGYDLMKTLHKFYRD